MYGQVSTTRVNERLIDLGLYINPDDISRELSTTGAYDASAFRLYTNDSLFRRFAWRSGLIGPAFTKSDLAKGGRWVGRRFKLHRREQADRFAQLLTQFLCHQLIRQKRKFSFETVFSHASKLVLMRRARVAGYKVYLYFIATDDPAINVERVAIRVEQGGHDVPRATIIRRHGLSIAQLPEALTLAYHAFLFDNSKEKAVMFCEVKETGNGRAWYWDAANIPDWFIRHYLLKDPTLANLDLARRALEARGKNDAT